MNFKMILIICLLVLIVVSLITFGYTTYAIRSDGSKLDGKDHMDKHNTMIVTLVIMQLMECTVAGLLMYRISKDYV